MTCQVNRRDALKLAGSAACVGTAGLVSAAQPKKPRWKSAIGLNGFESASNKYGKKFAIWDVLDFASRAGFDGVELVPTWPAPMSGYPAPDDTRAIRRLRRLYAGFGLQVFSIQTYGAGADDPDPKVRRQWLDGWRRNARFAKAVGADCIGIWPGGPLGNQTEAQAVDHLAESFREVWRCAGELGLTASCEIEPPFVFHSEEHMMQILEKAPGSRVNVDFAHFDMFSGGHGRIADLIRRIGVKKRRLCTPDRLRRHASRRRHLETPALRPRAHRHRRRFGSPSSRRLRRLDHDPRLGNARSLRSRHSGEEGNRAGDGGRLR